MKHLLITQNSPQHLVDRVTGPLAIAAHARGITVHDISAVGDMSGVKAFPDDSPYDNVLVYGSIYMVHEWAGKHPDLSQYIYWSGDAQSAQVWADNLQEDYHNGDGHETTPREASGDQPRHYRPMTTTKKIAGTVTTSDGLKRLAREKNIEDDFRLWSSALKIISSEVRCFVIEGKIVTASMYRLDGEMRITTDHPLVGEAVKEAERIIRKFSPARHFVIDMGLIEGRWGIIEFNPLHSSGWYACDPGAVLDAYFELGDKSV